VYEVHLPFVRYQLGIQEEREVMNLIKRQRKEAENKNRGIKYITRK
jgi:hypothetical protein